MKLKHYGSQLIGCTLLLVIPVLLTAQVLPADPASATAEEVIRGLNALERDSYVSETDLLVIDAAIQAEGTPYRGRFFRLAGWQGRLEALRLVPIEYRRSLSAKNDYDLALLRAGDRERLALLQRLIPTLEVDDDFVYRLGPALLYTRRREVFDFFLEQIMLDQRNCTVADAHTAGRINCAYRLLEMIAPLIEEFPLERHGSGDLATDDYPAALETARSWIREHRNDYRVITETY